MKFKSLRVVVFAGLFCLPLMSCLGQDDLSTIREKAEQGDANAQSSLGWRYWSGNGVPQDYKEAAKWCRLAAEQGFINAQGDLARAYFNGEGVSKDYKEAAKWARLAAAQGDKISQLLLGDCYEKIGEDLTNYKEQDVWYQEAVKLYRPLAEKGDALKQPQLDGHSV